MFLQSHMTLTGLPHYYRWHAAFPPQWLVLLQLDRVSRDGWYLRPFCPAAWKKMYFVPSSIVVEQERQWSLNFHLVLYVCLKTKTAKWKRHFCDFAAFTKCMSSSDDASWWRASVFIYCFSIYKVVLRFTTDSSHVWHVQIDIAQSHTDYSKDFICAVSHSVTCNRLTWLLLL